MAYSGYQKSARVLAAVAHALAAEYDVTENLMAEAARNARHPLTDPEYLPSVAARAWRWGPELHEISSAMRDKLLPGKPYESIADVTQRWEERKDQWDVSLAVVLDDLKDD